MTTETNTEVAVTSASSVRDAGSGSVNGIDNLPVFAVPLNSLRPGFFLRQTGTDASHVQLLADIVSSDELPAILVQKGSLRVVDGMHRIEAARLRGQQSINARLVNCTDAEAFILAVKSNTLHGLPLSRADRVSGAKRILAWHHDWSNRAVAAATGLSAKTIAGLRAPLVADEKDDGKRLGRDGKRRPVTGADGRKRAVEYLATHPDSSLREVARETDVSIGTVHDIRARLRRGEDPLRVGPRRSSGEQTANGSVAGRPHDRSWPDSGTSPHANGADLRSIRRNGLTLTWPSISSKLANDPAVKYTEGGRTFLRWMAMHVIDPDEWDEFTSTIPPHWAEGISCVAQGVSDAWREFADQLRERRDSAV